MSELYHYVECGLDNVWLDGGVETHDTPYGPATSITDMDGLHMEIAKSICRNPKGMTGAEFRFLRVELDLSQATLAQLIGNTEKNIQRWETGATKAPNGTAALALVNYFASKLLKTNVAEMMERLAELDRRIIEHRTFINDGEHWEAEAA